jgi:hypothetical protein
MTSDFIIKQIILNKLNLPHELSEKIKSFCFYDIITYNKIIILREAKFLTNYFIKNAVSRSNHYSFYVDNNNDNDEFWIFWSFSDYIGKSIQFQGYNCKYCGNYKISDIYYSNKILCICDE